MKCVRTMPSLGLGELAIVSAPSSSGPRQFRPDGGRAHDHHAELLGRTGADEATARRAYGALHTYTIGFAALEASRARWAPTDEDVSGLAQQLAVYTTAEQFMTGLHYLLDGIIKQVTIDLECGQ